MLLALLIISNLSVLPSSSLIESIRNAVHIEAPKADLEIMVSAQNKTPKKPVKKPSKAKATKKKSKTTKKTIGRKAKYYKQEVNINGIKRYYYIYIPASLDLKKKHPAVIAFHGFESDANGLRWLIEPDKYADKHGYIMIYPNAINKSWNAGKGFGTRNSKTDDVSFAAALPDVVTARHPIDKKRLYTMGFSNGAQMSALMLCKLSHKIAAGAMVAHTMNIKQCNPKHKTPVALIHGDKDTLAPYKGGGKHNLSSHKQSIEFFRKVNKTAWKPKKILDKKTVACFSDYGYKTEVNHCTTKNAGHSWPGGKEFKTELFGKTNKELNANDYLFSFFNKYRNIAPKRKKANLYSVLGKKSSSKKKTPSKKKSSPNKKKIAANKNKKTAKNKATSKNKPVASKPLKFKKHQLQLGKKKREYAVLIPSLHQANEDYAINIVLTPKDFDAQAAAELVEAKRMGEVYRHIFAFPKGDWKKNSKSDVRFIEKMIYDIQKKYIDSSRDVYIYAFSDGGHLAQRLYCQTPELISAFAFIAYSWKEESCTALMQPPMFIVHSKQDKQHPYKGRKKDSLISHKQTLDMIKDRHAELLIKTTPKKGKNYRCTSWSDVNNYFELQHCATEWGGNTVPGSRYKYPDKYGKVMSNMNANLMAIHFFEKHPHHEYSVTQSRGLSKPD